MGMKRKNDSKEDESASPRTHQPKVIVISDDDDAAVNSKSQPQSHAMNTRASARRRQPSSTAATPSTPSASATRAQAKATATARPRTQRASETSITPQRKVQRRSTNSPKKSPEGEKRLRQFRNHAPQSFLIKLERAATQRLCVLDRSQDGTEETPEQTFKIAGSTGNVYTVKVAKRPDCNCPDALKGNLCKHIVYILHNVLKAPAHLEYQLAFLSSELREMFANAPSFPTTNLSSAESHGGAVSEKTVRKPIEGDCPICFMEMGAPGEEEKIIWCKTCGNNVHASCFKQWAAQSPGAEYGKSVPTRCVYCRASWQFDMPSMAEMLNSGDVTGDGYVNVAQHLGLSGERDTSTYHRRPDYASYGYNRY